MTEISTAVAPVRIGIIGAGSMGSAIARGLVESGAVATDALCVCDLHAEKLADLAETGVRTVPDVDAELAWDPHVLLLAVKPQAIPPLLDDVSSRLAGRLVVSIAAGIPLSALERCLPGARVVRVMPNLPVAVRSGASAVAGGSEATPDDVELVRALFASLGSAKVMREDQLDVEGAVVGCAPAFFALMVDALTRPAIRSGLAAADAREMLESTMRGVAETLLRSKGHPRAYMELVSSPGGTTIEALRALEPPLAEGCERAVDAALARTGELGRN